MNSARSEQAAELRALFINNDASMKKAAAAAFAASDLLPNSGYSIPEKTPDQKYFGNGRDIPSQQSQIPQFGSGSVYKGDMAALKSH
jgi:hypothetical protein